MERLTDCAQGYCEVYCDFYASCASAPDVCERKYEVLLYERLKDYEGTGLVPEVINDAMTAASLIAKSKVTSVFGVDAERLHELAKAEKEGRLVELPCKVGDIVYGAETAPVIPLHVIEPAVYMESTEGGDFETLDNFGKTVFLTREEAETALKGGGADV